MRTRCIQVSHQHSAAILFMPETVCEEYAEYFNTIPGMRAKNVRFDDNYFAEEQVSGQ